MTMEIPVLKLRLTPGPELEYIDMLSIASRHTQSKGIRDIRSSLPAMARVFTTDWSS